MAGRLFSLVVMVDWSAAAGPGPRRPAPDRCWFAWGTATARPPAVYCRTRAEAEAKLKALLDSHSGPALVGFDFPFGYPAGAGLGGGRPLAARLAAMIEDGPSGANNRFAVAAALNHRIGRPPGPFWGCPAACADRRLRPTRPDFAQFPFAERRLVEQRLAGRRIMTTWQLLGRGAVGSQVLLGLPAVHRLVSRPPGGRVARIWPFETAWDAALDGLVVAEVWPSLADHAAQPHAVKDARQVMAMRDWLLAADAAGLLRAALARPAGLDDAAAAVCQHQEGWIVGAELLSPAAGP